MDNKLKIVTRIPISLEDQDFFCNKSWTLSFNMNTMSWISFHSYLPNWYIGENNFFYSGKNNCCSNIDTSFNILVAEVNRNITTTTTTEAPFRTTTTTTTEIPYNCEIVANIIQTNCSLEAVAYVTVPSTPTTTICQRPLGLSIFKFYKEYIINEVTTTFTTSFNEACLAITNILNAASLPTLNYDLGMTENLAVNNIVYFSNLLTDCTYLNDGYYLTPESFSNGNIFHVNNGIIVEVLNCNCPPKTTTTTTTLNLNDCCTVLGIIDGEIFVLSPENNFEKEMLYLPNIPSILGIALTEEYLWTVNSTEYTQWDITLSPFTATYNKTISFPGTGFGGKSIAALNNNTLIVANYTNYPTSIDISEMDVSGYIGIETTKFTLLQVNITSNLLYTSDGKLIFGYEDLTTNINYISQYDYTTNTLEYNISTFSDHVINIYECNCNLFFTDYTSKLYFIDKNTLSVAELRTIEDFSVSNMNQYNSCSIGLTTTTTTVL